MKRISIACVAACLATSALAQGQPELSGTPHGPNLRLNGVRCITQEQMAAVQAQLATARAELKALKDAAASSGNGQQKAQ